MEKCLAGGGGICGDCVKGQGEEGGGVGLRLGYVIELINAMNSQSLIFMVHTVRKS